MCEETSVAAPDHTMMKTKEDMLPRERPRSQAGCQVRVPPNYGGMFWAAARRTAAADGPWNGTRAVTRGTFFSVLRAREPARRRPPSVPAAAPVDERVEEPGATGMLSLQYTQIL